MIINDKQTKLINKWLEEDRFKMKLSVNHLDMLHQILKEKVYNTKQQQTLNEIRNRWITYKGLDKENKIDISYFQILNEDGTNVVTFGDDYTQIGNGKYHIGVDTAKGDDYSSVVVIGEINK